MTTNINISRMSMIMFLIFYIRIASCVWASILIYVHSQVTDRTTTREHTYSTDPK